MNKALGFLLALLYPPKCPGCGELMELEPEPPALCPQCLRKWNDEKNAGCPVCHRPACQCRCQPIYNKNRTADSYRCLVLYRDGIVSRLIMNIKLSRDPVLFSFFASELCNIIISSVDITGGDIVLTYPPRGKASIKKYGHDHAELLCNDVAKRLKLPVYRGLGHRKGGVQKELEFNKRGENAFKSFYIKDVNDAALKGKHIIFIDDVVTSGATTVAVAALCKLAGAAKFSVFSLARTPQNGRKHMKERIFTEG